jgi:transposase
MDWLLPPPNLPTLQPGETLYSWAGYVYAKNAVLDPRELSRRLYGAPYAALLHDFPAHLDGLDIRLAGALGNPRDLALSRTLLGYFLPPLASQVAAELLSRTRVSAYSTIKFKLGIPASRVGGNHPLKACCSCISEDEVGMGRAYWHIEHQFPSALVCVKHERMLRWVQGDITPVHQRGWILPTFGLPRKWLEPPEPPARQVVKLMTLAEYSSAWAQLAPASLDSQQLSRTYQAAMRANGWVTTGGNLRLRDITAAVKDHFHGLDALPGLASIAVIRDDWPGLVGTLARSAPRSGHPLKHLLLISMLFPDWTAFLRAYEGARGPVPEPKTDIEDNQAATPAPMSAFAALVKAGSSLSSAAAEIGVSTSTGVRWAKLLSLPYTSRAKSLKPQMLDAVRACLRRGVTKEEVSRTCGISAVSLNRLLSSEPALAEEWRKARTAIMRTANRAQFLRAIRSHPGWTIKQLRRLRGNGYMWLYRHDREWLLHHLPGMWSSAEEPPDNQPAAHT